MFLRLQYSTISPLAVNWSPINLSFPFVTP
jgi:hypothetical protein